jgi:hypothetical protein
VKINATTLVTARRENEWSSIGVVHDDGGLRGTKGEGWDLISRPGSKGERAIFNYCITRSLHMIMLRRKFQLTDKTELAILHIR